MTRVLEYTRAAGIIVCGVCFHAGSGAAILSTQNWILGAELESEAGYDTNLTARSDGTDDMYVGVTPRLSLSRSGSLTRFELEGQVTRRWFDEFDEYDSTDPRASLVYEYPAGPGDLPTSHLDLRWARVTAANTDLGRRVRSENASGRLEKEIFNTGRTALVVTGLGQYTDYDDDTLNTNEVLGAGARLAYPVSPDSRLGLGYVRQWTRSLGAAGRGDTDGDEDRVILYLDGQLLAKVRGSLETGVTFVSYSGLVNRDDTAWIAAVNLTWEPTELTDVSLRVSRNTDFSPEGETALRSEVLLDLAHDLGRGFSMHAGGGVARVLTEFEGIEHNADSITLLAGVAYQLTERFSARIDERWTKQYADRATFDYDRHLVTGQLTFAF